MLINTTKLKKKIENKFSNMIQEIRDYNLSKDETDSLIWYVEENKKREMETFKDFEHFISQYF